MAQRVRSDERSVVLSPLRDFLRTESAGGVALLAAAAVALVWANSPWQDSYVELWETVLSIDLGGHELSLDLRGWINEGLMAIFFFVVGLEIKRELVDGELREPRRAALPAIAAVGGMIVPATAVPRHQRRWRRLFRVGDPDGDRHRHRRRRGQPARCTRRTVAQDLPPHAGDRRRRRRHRRSSPSSIPTISTPVRWWSPPPSSSPSRSPAGCTCNRFSSYVVLGLALWLALHESGIHATLTGVILGLMTPTRPMRRRDLIDADELTDLSSVEAAHRTMVVARQSVSVVEWLEHLLHPWTSFVIVPLFALANAGVPITGGALSDALSSPLTYGIVIGLVVGKPVGITAVHVGGGAPRHRRAAGVRPPGVGSSASARSPASASPSRCS